jgi:Sugar-binding cellulase-like
MKRRGFLNSASGLALGTVGGAGVFGQEPSCNTLNQSNKQGASSQPYPLAITMWEFSWLERRWPGAGYEDWDQALSELVERGYDAIRIDAFPHLIYEDAEREYLLLPHWHTQDWGSPEINRVQVQPNLNKFLERCKKFNVRVGLSSWFRTDEEDVRMKLNSARKLGEV